MSKTTQYSALISTYLGFVELNKDENSQQQDTSEIPLSEWSEGSGSYQFTSGFFKEGILGSGSTLTLDFQGLTQQVFGMNVSKEWNDLRLLAVENLSGSGVLNVGSSGLSNHVGLFASDEDIRQSGVAVLSNPSGYPLSSSKRYVRLINYNPFEISYKVFALGVAAP